jgi:hypothetical protein
MRDSVIRFRIGSAGGAVLSFNITFYPLLTSHTLLRVWFRVRIS